MIELAYQNFKTDEGFPFGGWAVGTGFNIKWQRGPLVDPETGNRLEPNGAFVETVLKAVLQRIEFYQDSPFNCEENAAAIFHIKGALEALNTRTARRTDQGVEGTWEGS